MSELFKILKSIIFALLLVGCILSFIAICVELFSYINNEENRLYFALGIIWISLWVGFLTFGIMGTILWRLFLLLFNRYSLESMHQHVFSAASSAFACTILLALTQISNGVSEASKVLVFLIFILPLTFISLRIYKRLYVATKT
jgi:hypothetical protein